MYVISKGRELRHSGTIYPAGAEAPQLDHDQAKALLADGCIHKPAPVRTDKPKPRKARKGRGKG